MKKWINKVAPLVKKAVAYRESHHIPEMSIDTVSSALNTKTLILTTKVDGENNTWEYENGKLTFANKYGTLRQDIVPLSQEFEQVLNEQGIEHLLGAGELVALGKNGEKLPLNEVMSIIKAPRNAEQEAQIMIAVFDLLEIDHTPISGKYYERILLAKSLLGDNKLPHVQTVFAEQGDINLLHDLWKNKVLGPDNWEGLVVHLDDSGSVFKVKHISTLDALVIAASEGDGKNKGSLGALVIAMGNKKTGNLLYAGRVGTGFTDEERAQWWKFVQENRVREGIVGKENVIFVKPKAIIEIAYSFVVAHPTAAFKWDGQNYIRMPNDEDGGVTQTPRMYGLRKDKTFDPNNFNDIRLEQMPLNEVVDHQTAVAAYRKIVAEVEVKKAIDSADVSEIERERLRKKFDKIRQRTGLGPAETPKPKPVKSTSDTNILLEHERARLRDFGENRMITRLTKMGPEKVNALWQVLNEPEFKGQYPELTKMVMHKRTL